MACRTTFRRLISSRLVQRSTTLHLALNKEHDNPYSRLARLDLTSHIATVKSTKLDTPCILPNCHRLPPRHLQVSYNIPEIKQNPSNSKSILWYIQLLSILLEWEREKKCHSIRTSPMTSFGSNSPEDQGQLSFVPGIWCFGLISTS